LLSIVLGIKPNLLIPVHSEKPEFYIEKLKGSEIEVKMPEVGGVIVV
jgi:hypothetical protein